MYMSKTEPYIAKPGIGDKTYCGILLKTRDSENGPGENIKTAIEVVWAQPTKAGTPTAPFDPLLEWVKEAEPEPEPEKVVEPEPVKPDPVVVPDKEEDKPKDEEKP